MLSKLTIAGLNTYSEGHIWDKLNLPEGVDKDTLITEIIRQGSEFSVIYTEPNFLTDMIGKWSDKWYHNFERWWTAYNFDYNALYNLEVEARFEDDNHTDTTGENHIDGNMVGQKAAYDSDYFRNSTKDTNHADTDLENHVDTHNVRTEKRWGNQGVTMSQDMLQAELDVWYNNIYTMMAEVFVTEFCICIYD